MNSNKGKKEFNKEQSSIIDITDNLTANKIKGFENKIIINLNSDRNNVELNQTDIPSLKNNEEKKVNENNGINNNNTLDKISSISTLSNFSKNNKCFIFFESLCTNSFKKCFNIFIFILSLILFLFNIINILKISVIEIKIHDKKKHFIFFSEVLCTIFIIGYFFINNCILSSYLMDHFIILIFHIIIVLYFFLELFLFLKKKEVYEGKLINLFFSILLCLIPFINLIIIKYEKKKNKVALHHIEEIINFTEINKKKAIHNLKINFDIDEKMKSKLGKKEKNFELIEEKV